MLQVLINGKDMTHKFNNLGDGATWAICDALTEHGYHYIIKTATVISMEK